MKLKKMEITGFKSFGEKTAIEFPSGISAIVGPNGCGKSNVVDALRWAMGEQSVKKLRGKSMEDVIFAGANGMRPMNMAEVSLVLANENGQGPESIRDFTEVMLTRRLFRSGESAYFINKRPCRLKDIHDIFLGSGMGAKSYAVIQQGNIGAITEAGPHERRFFIEEAAGISRYKKQKKETISKLEATRQNLLRVKDIISEVERQAAGLKRQARKAERYNRYKEELRNLDIRLSIRLHDDLSQKILKNEFLLKELKDEDIEYTSRLNKLDAAVEDIKIRLARKNDEIAKKKERKFEIRRKIDRKESDLDHFKKDVIRLDSEISGMDQTLKELEKKSAAMLVEIRQTKERNNAIKETIKNTSSLLEKEKTKTDKYKEEFGSARKKLDLAKAKLMELVAREAKHKNITQHARTGKESLKRKLKMADEKEALALKKIGELESEKIMAQKQKLLCHNLFTKITDEISSLHARLDEENKILAQRLQKTRELDIRKNKIKSGYLALKKMEDNFEWFKSGVKAIMGKSKIREKAAGLVADIIEPKPGFEAPVEAVLGDVLQYIILKDEKSCIDLISFLKDENLGRSGFISFLPGLPGSAPKKKDCDYLLDHVAVKPGFEALAQKLLGNVIMADDLAFAVKMAGEGKKDRAFFVTSDGDMVTPEGFITGGSKDKLSGILEKKQEIRNLEKELKAVEKDLEHAVKMQKTSETKVHELENELYKKTGEKQKAADDEMEADKALYKVSRALEHETENLEILRMDQDQLMDESEGISRTMEKSLKILEQISKEIKDVKNKVAVYSENMDSISLKSERFERDMVDLKLKLTSLNAELESGVNSLNRLKEFRQDNTDQSEKISRALFLKKNEKKALEDKITNLEKSVAALYESFGQAEKDLEKDENDYTRIDEQLKKSDKSISGIRDKRGELFRKMRLIEVEISQMRIKKENIESGIKERYHKSILAFKNEFATKKDAGQMSCDRMKGKIAKLRKKIERMNDVNPGAISEYEKLNERANFLKAQKQDLEKAMLDLKNVIKKINKICQERFINTFNMVNEKLAGVFPRLFEGGKAALVLSEPDNPLESGVEFMVHPPGKRLTRLSLLSGGEKALSAIAFVFSIFLIKPASFCILDEIDAPLDDANVFRFNELLKIIGEKSQIIMITHKRKSMEFADRLFGITMEKKGISKVVSVSLN